MTARQWWSADPLDWPSADPGGCQGCYDGCLECSPQQPPPPWTWPERLTLAGAILGTAVMFTAYVAWLTVLAR